MGNVEAHGLCLSCEYHHQPKLLTLFDEDCRLLGEAFGEAFRATCGTGCIISIEHYRRIMTIFVEVRQEFRLLESARKTEVMCLQYTLPIARQ